MTTATRSLLRHASGDVVRDQDVNRAAGNQFPCLLCCGLLVRPPGLARTPNFGVDTERAPEGSDGEPLYDGSAASRQDEDIGTPLG